MKNKVYIRGKSLTCSLGEKVDEIISRVGKKEYKVDFLPIQLSNLDYTRPYFCIHRNYHLNKSDRFYDILFYTVSETIKDAGLEKDEVEGLSIFFGSTSMDMPIFELDFRESSMNSSDKSPFRAFGYGKIASAIANEFNIKGSCYTYNTACTSSANGFFYAASMIDEGVIDSALIVGFDLYCDLGFFGFEGLKLLAPEVYKPFDKKRDGIIMGEGCGAVIIDRQKKSKEDFYYLGGANICDTTSVTSHDTEGTIIEELLNQSLKNSGLKPDDIDIIKAHATGSYDNDLAECRGYKRVFKDNIPPVTGIKPFIGHTVGASGINELIIITEAVKQGFVPATLGFNEPDEDLGIIPITENYRINKGIFMLNCFGFGGNCVSLIVSNNQT